MNTKTFVWGSVVLGLIFIVIAIYYWITPAGMLASFVPGFETGVTTVHFKHGLASLILGLGLFVFAWFKSGPAAPTGSQ
ncbi:MAG: hypothetical protein JWL75_153 [Parcubacteria group bacterium]|nr:hypothetical protein [Parcubacteria group bacterium]